MSVIILDLLTLLATKKISILKIEKNDKTNKNKTDKNLKLVKIELIKISNIELTKTCFLNTDIIFSA